MPAAATHRRPWWARMHALAALVAAVIAIGAFVVVLANQGELTGKGVSEGPVGAVLNVSDLGAAYARLFPHARFLIDPTQALTPAAVADRITAFEVPGPRSPLQSFLFAAIWQHVQIVNDTDAARTVVLEYIEHSASYMEVHGLWPGEDTPRLVGRQTLFAPLEARPLESPRFAVPLSLRPGETVEVFVKAGFRDGPGPQFADLRIWDDRAFATHRQVEDRFSGFFAGVLLSVAALAIVAAMATNERVFLAYGIFVLMSFANGFSMYGGGYQVFARDGYHWAVFVFFMTLLPLGAIWFARELLETRTHLPRWDKVLLAFALLAVVSAAIAALQWAQIIAVLTVVSNFSYAVLLIAGILRWRQGAAVGAGFALSWSVLVIGGLLFGIMYFGLIDFTLTVYYLPAVGAMIEVVLLMGLLAVRINALREAKQAAEKRYLDGLETAKTDLEWQVALRTKELRLAKETAEREARTDPLTGVANRRRLIEMGQVELNRNDRAQTPLALVMMDIDHFKRVNDDHGHDIGDAVLRAFAAAVSEALRDYDLFGRMGGEEFAAILPDTTRDEAQVIAERLRLRIAAMAIDTGEAAIRITVSLGLTMLTDGDNLDRLFSRSDAALYAAKQAGRNRMVIG